MSLADVGGFAEMQGSQFEKIEEHAFGTESSASGDKIHIEAHTMTTPQEKSIHSLVREIQAKAPNQEVAKPVADVPDFTDDQKRQLENTQEEFGVKGIHVLGGDIYVELERMPQENDLRNLAGELQTIVGSAYKLHFVMF